MKLRNKKTGGICGLGHIRQYWRREKDGGMGYCLITSMVDGGEQFIYNSLAEMMEEWEDYKPAEPLIKDEKIRKAVRAWAEADDLDNFRVQNQHFNECKIIGYTAGINKASFIGFQTTIAHADNKKLYTITELCGEDKE